MGASSFKWRIDSAYLHSVVAPVFPEHRSLVALAASTLSEELPMSLLSCDSLASMAPCRFGLVYAGWCLLVGLVGAH